MPEGQEKAKVKITTEQKALSLNSDVTVAINGIDIASAELPNEVNSYRIKTFINKLAEEAYELGFEQGQKHARKEIIGLAAQFAKAVGWVLPGKGT